ncbi:insoluble domain protein [Rhodococcus sp. NPDC003318]|uniref:insoluble domain protein n=1 Tax=Rhodococcus sp. NPDC003318 TaxID=3364503 RepID=UPI0036BE7238
MSRAVTRGAHRRRVERVSTAGALPVALAIVCSGVATAAPAEQPGVTDEVETSSQPGVSDPEFDPAPAEAVAPAASDAPKQYWVAPPAEYDNVPTRPAPTSYYEEYDAPIAPASVQDLHLPVVVEPVAPIEAPAERLRLGDYVADKPNWLSEENLDKTNNTAAAYEAQVNTAWRSVGIEASRADRIGAATVGGAATYGLGVAAATGIPAAVVGGLIGGTLGGMFGVGVVAPAAGVVLPVVGFVSGPVLSTANGAAIGAAVVGIPVAVVAGTIAGVVGGAQGMAFGAGDTLAEPIELEIPDAPTVDPGAITEQTRATVAHVETLPGGVQAVTAVRDAVEWVPPQIAAATEQARTTALGQPGGPDLVRRIEASATATADAFAPVTSPVNEVLGAIAAALG